VKIKIVETTYEKTISLPPAKYTINAYIKNENIGEKQVELTNDKHLTFVTTVDSLFPVVLSLLFYVLFGFLVVLTLLKKFSLSSLLKSLAILFIILSLFQPWWMLISSSAIPPAEKTTTMYVNPGVMIKTTKYFSLLSFSPVNGYKCSPLFPEAFELGVYGRQIEYPRRSGQEFQPPRPFSLFQPSIRRFRNRRTRRR
jgi:uncharacterized membrane protein YqjE